MKIRPVILCGGAGTRLWPNSNNHQAKQFIDFGNWTLLGKTLERTKASIYDAPIISTNKKYLKQVKQHLKKNKIKKYKIVLEPSKRNTAPAILSTALIKAVLNIAGAVFLFVGSKTILYFLILFFLRCFLTSFRYFLLVLIIGVS